jgi:hypothetical protein
MVDFEQKEPRSYIDPHTGLFRDRKAEQERYERWLRKVGEWAVILMILGWLALAVVFG